MPTPRERARDWQMETHSVPSDQPEPAEQTTVSEVARSVLWRVEMENAYIEIIGTVIEEADGFLYVRYGDRLVALFAPGKWEAVCEQRQQDPITPDFLR